MEDSLNIGGGSEVRSSSTLTDTFKKWVKIDFWASIVPLVLFGVLLGDTLSEASGSMGNGIMVTAILTVLSIVFANMKKYALLVFLGIYENTKKND